MKEELSKRDLLDDETGGTRLGPDDADYYLNYTDGLFGTEDEADFLVKRILLSTYLRMLRLFKADDPDQSSTYWPTGPSGTKLIGNDQVVAAIESYLADLHTEDIDGLTRFLYELREFDRTRKLSDALGKELWKYRLSQAIWAGQAEFSKIDVETPEIDPDISFLTLPGE